jgi:hypothetical protein
MAEAARIVPAAAPPSEPAAADAPAEHDCRAGTKQDGGAAAAPAESVGAPDYTAFSMVGVAG